MQDVAFYANQNQVLKGVLNFIDELQNEYSELPALGPKITH